MRFKGLDLNLLVALDALLTTRNVTAAGEKVFLSQSAMSGALARLREFFGDELFVQVGRKLVLTSLAEGLVEPVRQVLVQIDGTVNTRPMFDPAVSRRHFNVVASDYGMSALLADVVRRVHRIAPGISFDLRLVTEGSIDELQRGDVDIIMMPEHYALPDHPKVILFEEDYHCVVWTDNPLVGDEVSLEQYMALGHVVVRHGRIPTFDAWFLQRFGQTRRVEVVVPNFNLAPQLLVGTDRIATVHTRLAALYADHLELRLLPTPIEFPRIVEVAQWHKYRERDPAIIWLCDLMREVAQAERGLNDAPVVARTDLLERLSAGSR